MEGTAMTCMSHATAASSGSETNSPIRSPRNGIQMSHKLPQQANTITIRSSVERNADVIEVLKKIPNSDQFYCVVIR